MKKKKIQWELVYLHVSTGTVVVPTATLRLRRVNGVPDAAPIFSDTATGKGPVDAIAKAIARITKTKRQIVDFQIRSMGSSSTAIGSASVRMKSAGGRNFMATESDMDILKASALVIIDAINMP